MKDFAIYQGNVIQVGYYYPKRLGHINAFSEGIMFLYIVKEDVVEIFTGEHWFTLNHKEFENFCIGGKMPIRIKRIKELKVYVVECPMKDRESLTGGMVRVATCRSCKSYCGEHGGDYVECSFES